MKLKALIVLLLCSVATAQHPMDFVPDDAIGLLVINDGSAINSVLQTVDTQSGMASATPDVLETFLSQYIDNPHAIDFTSEVLVILEPTITAPGQKPAGMFGPMPHFMVVCKAKDGQTLKANKASGLTTEALKDGWFIATGATKWSTRTSEKLSPIVEKLPETNVALVIEFAAIWSKFSPIIQMTGGMAVSGLNSPGPDGVITPETKRAAKSAQSAFGNAMKEFADVKAITGGFDFEDFTAVVTFDIESISGKSPKIDNSSMIEMASSLASSGAQHAMSEKLTRKLMELDFEALQEFAGSAGDYANFITPAYRKLAELTELNVVSYDVSGEKGFTVAVLGEYSNQNEYMKLVPEVIVSSAEALEQYYSMELSTADASYKWNVSIMSDDAEYVDVMNAVVPKGTQVRFGKQGSDRIAMMFGPKNWKAFTSPHSSALAQVIKPHARNVEIDYAMSMNFRKFAVGVMEIDTIANGKDSRLSVKDSPSAKNSILFGTTETGTFIEIKSDLYGLATLVSELDIAE